MLASVNRARAILAGPRSVDRRLRKVHNRLTKQVVKRDRRVDKRVAQLDRRLARFDTKFESRVEKVVRKQKGGKREPPWTFHADGMATAHHSPFLDDPAFTALYEEMVEEWYPGKRVDVRWRVWLLVELVRQCEHLDGSMAEFGTYRAGVAFMLLGLTEVDRLYLFDTFAGIPSDRLTEYEAVEHFGGQLNETSPAFVEERLSRWAGRFTICPGDVFETLQQTETGPLSFVHMDLNVSAPTAFALDYVYPRLVPGGVMVLDDYGWLKCRDQRAVVEAFFSERPDKVIALPTGQGLMVKQGSAASTPSPQSLE